MQECMNSQEKALLDFLKGHYKATYEVMFLVSKKSITKQKSKTKLCSIIFWRRCVCVDILRLTA